MMLDQAYKLLEIQPSERLDTWGRNKVVEEGMPEVLALDRWRRQILTPKCNAFLEMLHRERLQTYEAAKLSSAYHQAVELLQQQSLTIPDPWTARWRRE